LAIAAVDEDDIRRAEQDELAAAAATDGSQG
jgi:hypothetical protein